MAKNQITIKEIFSSIQGEGPYIGEKHLFVRTTRCNLKCCYCDTDFCSDENSLIFTFDEFFSTLKSYDALTISFTGGEPLLEDEYLSEFLKKYKNRLNKKIYLETNGTYPEGLKKVIDYVDTIAMDIKLKSATGQAVDFTVFEEFLDIASKKDVFVKVVFDENIYEGEINQVCHLLKKYGVLLVLQPKMPIKEDFDFNFVFEQFYKKYKNVRLIPQMHKFLDIR